MNVAIQGDKYSYHDIVFSKLFKKENVVYCYNFKDVFDYILKSKDSLAIVAAENSIVGQINEVYDFLNSNPVSIVGEYFLEIKHCIATKQKMSFGDIKSVNSHPMALAQVSKWITKNLEKKIRIIETNDTAESAKLLANGELTDDASVICSREAAINYGLTILDDKLIEHNNYTRFLIIKNTNSKIKHDFKYTSNIYKTSLIFSVPHSTGSLINILRIFEKNNINMTKLYARPIREKAWHYYFYVDIETGIDYANIFDEIKLKTNYFKNLGSYPEHQL